MCFTYAETAFGFVDVSCRVLGGTISEVLPEKRSTASKSTIKALWSERYPSCRASIDAARIADDGRGDTRMKSIFCVPR